MKTKLTMITLAIFLCAGAFAQEAHTRGNGAKADTAGMVYVEGGTFQMGSTTGEYDNERPVHGVTVGSFYIGKYEVTQAEYQVVMGENPSCFKGDRRPVECVSWYSAVEYCNRRSRAEGLTPCYRGSGDDITCDWSADGYRLPTEAEWEYAATAGGTADSTELYSGGSNIDDVAWYGGNSGSQTHDVGTKAPNALGIYDMSGNVWEWCWDWYDKGYYSRGSAQNPTGPASGSRRIERGGSLDFNAGYCRCAYRDSDLPGNGYGDMGFRVVRSGGAR